MISHLGLIRTFPRIDAAKAIGKVYGKGEIASGTNLNYNDYYGGFYGK